MNPIKLGYEITTGKEVSISPSHMIVTGVSQLAGKTTALESLIKRSGKKAIVFRTKIGEKSFLEGNVIRPYFKDKADWRYVESLIEATMQQKLRSFDRSKIIQISRSSGANTLVAFKRKVDERLLEKKLNSFERDILTNLQAYLEIVLPKLQSIQFSDSLALTEGLNIMDLERFSQDAEVQSLIIRSTMEEILYHHKDVILVIPEAWKFIPQKRGNPCKQIVEEFIRQGATNHNFIWIDSQEMASIDKAPLKQITEWILGYQSEKNEVKHTLDQLPLPKNSKPKEDDIMSLGTGIFFYATRESTRKVYAQPFWLDDERARKIALGQLQLKDIDKPKLSIAQKPEYEKDNDTSSFSKTSDEKIEQAIFQRVHDSFQKTFESQQKSFQWIHDEIDSLKSDVSSLKTNKGNVNMDLIIKEVLNKMPKGQNPVYQVAPIEALKKEFLEEAKEKILADIKNLSDDSKRLLKYLESIGKGISGNEIKEKCFFIATGGGNTPRVNEAFSPLAAIEIARKDAGGKHFPKLKDRIKDMLQTHGASEQEINSVYDHIIFNLLQNK